MDISTGHRRSRKVIETVLGRPIPKGAEVHHIDENPCNFDNDNLVLCQDRKYHHLLHRRMLALFNCGNANWLLCSYCKKYDSPGNIITAKNNNQFYHKRCVSDYYYLRRKKLNPMVGRRTQ